MKSRNRLQNMTLARIVAFAAALLSVPTARANTLFHCACQLSPSCALGYGSLEDLLARSRRSPIPSILQFGKAVGQAVSVFETLPVSPKQEELQSRLAIQLKDLHELIEAENAFNSSDLRQLADQSRNQIAGLQTELLREQEAALSRPPPPVKTVVGPALTLADAIAIPEEPGPALFLYVTPRLSSFNKWMEHLGTETQKAIQRRLLQVAATGEFGDHKTTSARHVSELRLHLHGGPRIYYYSDGIRVVILNFNLKAEGDHAQDLAIEEATRRLAAFLSAQPI